MADNLTNQAVSLAIRDLEREVTEAARQYEDSERDGDLALASRLKVGSPRYFATITDHLDGPQKPTEQPARREQPVQPKPRYDGAARTMPSKPSAGRDQFQSLRDKSSPRAYGKK